MFKTIQEIRDYFIKDGWGKDTEFDEFSFEEAKERGILFAMDDIKKR